LFDMHGHVWVWCQERPRDHAPAKDGQAMEDNEDMLEVFNNEPRAMRGGAFVASFAVLRSAHRNADAPYLSAYFRNGFRPARTFR
jgi:formylglycine-generating enzyme required for sulfatase activity